jgi:Protein of unknown function (DUF429)
MSPETLIGIDFSGDAMRWRASCGASNVWLATGFLRGGEIHVASLTTIQQLPGSGEPFSRLCQFLREPTSGYAAIDAPFSIPAKFASSVEVAWQRVSSLPRDGRPFAWGADLVRAFAPELGARGAKILRKTEEYWRQKGVNVRSTMWAGPRGGAPFAVACMTLLAQHDGGVWPFRPKGERGCVLVEAFPAAQLRHWERPYSRYNGKAVSARALRESTVAWLEQERGLHMAAQFRNLCFSSADALDAIICLYAAAAVANGKLAVTASTDADTEGLIAIHA